MDHRLFAIVVTAQLLGCAVAFDCNIVKMGKQINVVVKDYALVQTDAEVVIQNSSKCELTIKKWD